MDTDGHLEFGAEMKELLFLLNLARSRRPARHVHGHQIQNAQSIAPAKLLARQKPMIAHKQL